MPPDELLPLLRALVGPDEAPARALLAEYLDALPGWACAGLAANGFEAVRLAAETDPDVLLLDVQMPKLDGFDVVELLGPRPGGRPAVVFVTAHDAYAVRAFEVAAVDYLLKPVAAARLAAALERARARLAAPAAADGPDPGAPALAAAARGARRTERILVREGERIHVLPAHRLDYAEARDDYVRLVAGGREHRKQQTLADLEATLDPARFVRVHRSFLLNVDRLAGLERYAKDSHAAVLADGTRIPVSRAGYARLRGLL
jgi:two-component system LytT family response regulator